MYKKENLGSVPSSNKRSKVVDSAMVGVGSCVRQPLSNSNVGPMPAPVADLNPGPNASAIDFNSREDVEMLLNEKMKGKNKNDYKANDMENLQDTAFLNAVVKVHCTHAAPDYLVPWQKQRQYTSTRRFAGIQDGNTAMRATARILRLSRP